MPHSAIALIAVLFASAGMAAADSADFQVYLGGRLLGTARAEVSGTADQRVYVAESVLDNTPLGVADGTYVASSRPVGAGAEATLRRFVSQSESGRDIRTISVLLDRGRAVETEVAPDSERTGLSDPALVPAAVLDPAAAFALLALGTDCPEPFLIYDGRRVVQVTTRARDPGLSRLTCRLDYRVISGPGHLSPFRFRSLAITLTYPLAGAGVTGLRLMEVRVGLFRLQFRA